MRTTYISIITWLSKKPSTKCMYMSSSLPLATGLKVFTCEEVVQAERQEMLPHVHILKISLKTAGRAPVG